MRGVASAAWGVVVLGLGCAEVDVETQLQASRSAVTSATSGGLVVPAYFSDDAAGDASFAEIAAGHQSALPEIAVVNAGCDHSGRVDPRTGSCAIGGGPGGSRSTYVHDKIVFLRSRGIKVFGYVWIGPVTASGVKTYRGTADVVADMHAWVDSYADAGNPQTLVNGFFFDSAYRSSASSVSQAEYVAAQTAQIATWAGPAVGETGPAASGRAIFNWGTVADTYMQPYLDCVLRGDPGASDAWHYVVVQEDAASDIMADKLPDWARYRYNPGHFISIVHHAPAKSSDLPPLLSALRASWNSAYAYVTDLPSASDGSIYDAAPSPAVWQAESSQGGTADYAYGALDDALASSCPAPSSATPAYP
jgi:hypothetical protein